MAGDVVVDVSGHNGQCTLLMASLARVNGRVITFEPDPVARNILIENIKLNTDIAVIDVEPFAVLDTSGEAPFVDGHGSENSSLAAVGSVADARASFVKTVALDNYLNSRNIKNIALAKIDIEGAEIHALRGAANLLKSESEFLAELHPYAWEEFGVNFDELLNIAEKSNRELVYLEEHATLVDKPRYGTVLMRKHQRVGS